MIAPDDRKKLRATIAALSAKTIRHPGFIPGGMTLKVPTNG